MEKGVIERQYLFIPHLKHSENFHNHVTESSVEDAGIIISHCTEETTGPRKSKVNRKSATKTTHKPKSPDLENQGIVRAGRDLEISSTPSISIDEHTEGHIRKRFYLTLILQRR